MTAKTATKFDLETFKRAYEEWDVEGLLGLYAEGFELIQIDGDHPPSAPRVQRGTDGLRGMLEHCAAADVRAKVGNLVPGEDRAAATITCEFPGGRTVVANAILELEGGRIVRERDVLAGDPRS
jgi:hypothetical protein